MQPVLFKPIVLILKTKTQTETQGVIIGVCECVCLPAWGIMVCVYEYIYKKKNNSDLLKSDPLLS